MSPSKLKHVLLVASLLAIPLLAGLPTAQAAHGQPHTAVTPQFFRVNTAFTTTIGITEMGVGTVATTEVVLVKLPLGVVLSAEPTAPEGWTVGAPEDAEGRVQYAFTAPPPPAVPASAADLTFPVALAPCDGGFQMHVWHVQVETHTGGVSPWIPTEQWCDQKAPRVHAALPAQTDTAQDDAVLVVADETASSFKTASLVVTYPDGGTQTFTSTTTAVTVAIDPTKVGAWTYRVTMEDKAGNAITDPPAGQPGREMLVVDVTAPTATLAATSPQEAGKPTLVTHAFADNSGVAWATLRWRTDAAAPWSELNVTGQAKTESIVVDDHALTLQLSLSVTDPAGNGVEKLHTLTFTDTIAPTLSATVLPPADETTWRASLPTKVTLDATDEGTPKARLLLNWTLYSQPATGAALVKTGTGAPPLDVDLAGLPAAATHTLHWAGKDDKNNLNETRTLVFRVDPHAPVADLENDTSAPASGWFTTPTWITFKPVGGLSGLDYSPSKTFWTVDNATQPEWSARFATDGVRWLNWTATTNAGVAAHGPGIHLRLDTTPPALDLVLASEKPGSGSLHAGNVTVTLAATDPTSGVAQRWYTLNGAAEKTYEGPLTFLDDGVYTIHGRARNGAELQTTKSVTFTIDRAKPTLAILVNGSADQAAFNHSALVTVVATDTTSVTLACSVDGVPFNGANGITVTANGHHKAACNATDVAGNVANLTREFSVDQQAPVIVARGDLGFVRAFDGDVTIQDVSALQSVEGWLVSATGQGRVVTFTEDPDEPGLWRAAAPAGLADGVYGLDVRATDQFGRGSGWVDVLTFHLLTVAPTAEIYVPGGHDKGFLNKAEVTWKIHPHPAPAQMLVRVNDGAEAAAEQPLVVDAAGTTKVTFRTRDSAGNLGEPATYTFVLTAGSGGAPPPAPANRAPVVGGVSLNLLGDRVVATPLGVSDADGDSVQLTYRWRVNGADVPATGSSLAATSGQRVQAFVTPWDGKAFGATMASGVFEVPFDNPPVARFSFTGQPRAGTPFAFDASATNGGVAPLSYSWSFSDGGSATGARVSHSFVYVGDGHAELTVTDARGATSKLRRDFQVQAQEMPRDEMFSWRAPDGTTHVLEGERASGVTLLRELPGNALLLETPGGMVLWRPLAGTRDPVHSVGAAPGEARYADRTQSIPVGVPVTAGWALVTFADPQPGLTLADLVDDQGAAPAWWRDAEGIHVLTRAHALELRYGLSALSLANEVRPVPGQPGQWTITLTATGGGPITSLRLMDGERVIAEETGRTLRVTHASPTAATLRGVVRTDDGQEAVTTVTIPATAGQQPPTGTTPSASTPQPTPDEPESPPGDDDTPAPGAALVTLALVLVALVVGRRRRA